MLGDRGCTLAVGYGSNLPSVLAAPSSSRGVGRGRHRLADTHRVVDDDALDRRSDCGEVEIDSAPRAAHLLHDYSRQCAHVGPPPRCDLLRLCPGRRIWSSRVQLSRNLKPFPEHANKGPISDALPGPGKSSVFRHALLRIGFPYVLTESPVIARRRSKRLRCDLSNPTFFGADGPTTPARRRDCGGAGVIRTGTGARR